MSEAKLRVLSIDLETPTPRVAHEAVWTGTEMIVWSGTPSSSNGGRYCACPVFTTSYRDPDGDGYGDPALSVTTCDGTIPPGYGSQSGDCDQTNADLWAVPGEPLGLVWASNVSFGWSEPVAPGGNPMTLVYDTLRSGAPGGFDPADCVETNDGADTVATDASVPDSGEAYFYLVRPENACGAGTLGNGTAGPRSSGVACEN